MVVMLELRADDERAVMRVLRALLKRLGRDHGVRCDVARPIDPGASQVALVTHLKGTCR